MKCNIFVGILLLAVGLSGCVTESTGGMPAPAAADERISAQLDLARGYIEQRNFSRAKVPLERALEIDPAHVEARVLNAVLLQSENEFELAEDNYKAALRADGRDPQALNNYGSFLYSRERYEEAVEVLRKLVGDTSYRARSQAFENLGLALLKTAEAEQAEGAFTRALELNFRQPRSNLELADLAFQAGNYTEAASQLLSFRTYARQTPRSLCLSYKVARARGDQDQASSNLLALTNLFPQQAQECQAKI